MKQMLFATAAAAALLLTPMLASAQYVTPTPTTPPITSPQSDTYNSSTQTPSPMTAQAPGGSMSAESQSSSQMNAQAQDPNMSAGTTAQQSGAAGVNSSAPGYGASTPTYGASTYGSNNYASARMRGEPISDTKALELAQDAGMNAVPMTAAAVCQPRELDLNGGATYSNRNKLEFAVDRASVCELRQIEIPARGASTFRQTLMNQGVDASKITVADSGVTEVRMTFAGVATSGGQYAAIFNPMRSAQNNAEANAYAPAGQQQQPYTGYAPAPNATTPDAAGASQMNKPDETSNPAL